jgi:two-component system, OmpR family, heavy metal sensor histidine kinase CusS
MTTERTGVPLAPVRRRGHHGSIAARLAWLYVGATAALLLVAGLFLNWGLARSIRVSGDQLLASKMGVLRLLLQDPSKLEALKSEIEHEAGEGHAAKYYLRILAADGRIELETEGMTALLPAAIFPSLPPDKAGESPSLEYRGPTTRDFLLLTARAVTGAARPEPRTLHIARDISFDSAILSDSRRRLLIVFGAGSAFAALTGILVTRAGLRPLREITETTQSISVNHLSERLTAKTWPAELRTLASAFDAMLDRLQDSFNRLSAFSADIAHAMRNPINNLRGEAEVALNKVRTADEYRHTLGSSLEEFERLSRLIDGLLFIARADDPCAALERVNFSARREIEAVREFYEALAADRHVDVTCRGDANIAGDPILVRRAISNLLGNALKHTPEGGQVTLEAREVGNGAVEVIACDTGRGIKPQHLELVFERFFQVDKTGASNGDGAGLGLAIVRSIMRLHGGTASISSVVNRGTTVTLRFPPAQTPTKM